MKIIIFLFSIYLTLQVTSTTMRTSVQKFLLSVLVLWLVTIAEGYFDNTTDGFRTMDNLNEKQYRRERRSRKEPRFLSFETKNNNIEVSVYSFKY